jgi:hypothetical protein
MADDATASYAQSLVGAKPIIPTVTVKAKSRPVSPEARLNELADKEQSAYEKFSAEDDKIGDEMSAYSKKVSDEASAHAERVQKFAKGPDLKDVPEEKVAPIEPPYKALGQLLPMLAVIGSGLSRRASHGAIKAATAAMKAKQENDESAQAEAHKQFEDNLKVIKEQNAIIREKYDDAWKALEAGDRSKMDALMSEHDMLKEKSLLQQNKFKEFHDMLKGQGDIVSKIATIQHEHRQEQLEAQRIAQAAKAERDRLGYEYANMAPGTKAYNEAHADWLRQHPGDVAGALKAAADAEKAANPAMMRTMTNQEQAFRRQFEALPQVKAYNSTAQYGKTIDDALNKKLNLSDRDTQIAILDAFTKYATGGQAIREFMVGSALKNLSFKDEAELLHSRLASSHSEVLPRGIVVQYLNGAKDMRDNIESIYKGRIRQESARSSAMGNDPNAVWDPDELAVIQDGQNTSNGQSIGANNVKSAVTSEKEALAALDYIKAHNPSQYEAAKGLLLDNGYNVSGH